MQKVGNKFYGHLKRVDLQNGDERKDTSQEPLNIMHKSIDGKVEARQQTYDTGNPENSINSQSNILKVPMLEA